MPLIVSIFPKDSLSPKSLSEHFLGAKNLYLIMLVCGNSFSLHTPFPLQPSQAHEVVVVVGGSKHQKAAAAARRGSLSCITKQGCQRAAFIAGLPLLKLFQDNREQHT